MTHEEEDCPFGYVHESETPSRAPVLNIEAVTQVRNKVTTAYVTGVVEGRQFDGFGSAVCDDLDTPRQDTGMLLAVGRAVEELGHQIKKAGWKQVERHPTEKPPVVGTVKVRVVMEGFDTPRSLLDRLLGRR